MDDALPSSDHGRCGGRLCLHIQWEQLYRGSGGRVPEAHGPALHFRALFPGLFPEPSWVQGASECFLRYGATPEQPQ